MSDVEPLPPSPPTPTLSPPPLPPSGIPQSPSSSTGRAVSPPAALALDIMALRYQEKVHDVKDSMPRWPPTASLLNSAQSELYAITRPAPGAPAGSYVRVEFLKGDAYSADMLADHGPRAVFDAAPPLVNTPIPFGRRMGSSGVHIRLESPATSGKATLLVTSRPKSGASASDLVAGEHGLSSLLEDGTLTAEFPQRPDFARMVTDAVRAACAVTTGRKAGASARVQGIISDIKIWPMSADLLTILAPSNGRAGIVPEAEIFARAFPGAFNAVAFMTVTPLRRPDGGYIEHSINDPMKGGFFRIGRQRNARGWQADVADAITRAMQRHDWTTAFTNPGSGILPSLEYAAEWTVARASPTRAANSLLRCDAFCPDAAGCDFRTGTVESLRKHWARFKTDKTLPDPHGPSVLSPSERTAFCDQSHRNHKTVWDWFNDHVANLRSATSPMPHTAHCEVCMVHVEPINMSTLLRCGFCHILVHSRCYFTAARNRASSWPWSCRKCTRPHEMRAAETAPPSCILCPARSGPLYPTAHGKWVHTTCALYSNDVAVSFESDADIDPAITISDATASARDARCAICSLTMGACITCGHDGCSTSFHVTCALHQRYRCDPIAAPPASAKRSIATPSIYCPEHS